MSEARTSNPDFALPVYCGVVNYLCLTTLPLSRSRLGHPILSMKINWRPNKLILSYKLNQSEARGTINKATAGGIEKF